jgi:tRNA dimethylallyltransferase
LNKPDAILIAGPTASGKSNFALELAETHDGEIINTDSMQIFPVLRILTARPNEADLARVPHHLYGTTPLEGPSSVAIWMADAERVANEIWSRGKTAIFVGGTGLYFRGLEHGLAQVPDVPSDIRSDVRKRLLDRGSELLHAELASKDPEGAALLRPSDGQRIARALEVFLTTGRSLKSFQDQPDTKPLLDAKSVERYLVMPDRPVLHERINARTVKMMEEGAVEEVRKLLTYELSSEMSVMRAIGVKEISQFLAGQLTYEGVIEKIRAATRQYAKRQSTWFRGQLKTEWSSISKSEPS